ncbi:MAG: hypothetical protein ACI81T_001811 [Bacteroidia bacterium]
MIEITLKKSHSDFNNSSKESIVIPENKLQLRAGFILQIPKLGFMIREIIKSSTKDKFMKELEASILPQIFT